MTAPAQHTALVLKSEAAPTPYGAILKGTFTIALSFENTTSDLDHIEAQIETADQQCSQLVQHTQPLLIKNGKTPFTIVARCGEVHINRQRCTGKSNLIFTSFSYETTSAAPMRKTT